MPRKIGAVYAMAATGIVAKANAPPASIPAQRQVITNCAPLEASAKNATGTIPQAVPRMRAFRTSRCMARRDTNCGFAIRRDEWACQPKNVAPLATAAAQIKAMFRSGECHSAMASTIALQAFASMMPSE